MPISQNRRNLADYINATQRMTNHDSIAYTETFIANMMVDSGGALRPKKSFTTKQKHARIVKLLKEFFDTGVPNESVTAMSTTDSQLCISLSGNYAAKLNGTVLEINIDPSVAYAEKTFLAFAKREGVKVRRTMTAVEGDLKLIRLWRWKSKPEIDDSSLMLLSSPIDPIPMEPMEESDEPYGPMPESFFSSYPISWDELTSF